MFNTYFYGDYPAVYIGNTGNVLFRDIGVYIMTLMLSGSRTGTDYMYPDILEVGDVVWSSMRYVPSGTNEFCVMAIYQITISTDEYSQGMNFQWLTQSGVHDQFVSVNLMIASV